MSIMLDTPTMAALPSFGCPRWCDQPAGHPAELTDTDGSRMFVHRGVVLDGAAGRHVSLRQAVTAYADGTVRHEAAELVIDGVEAYTLDEARSLLAALAVGAVMIEGGR